MRNLNDRKARNILEFEIDKIISDEQLSVSGALNFFSPRPFSFTVPIGKRSTDPFLRLLDSSNKSAEMP